MCPNLSRRCFLKSTTAGALSLSALTVLAGRLAAGIRDPAPAARSRVRVGKIYLGHPSPGWPSFAVDLDAEKRRFEEGIARVAPALADIEFIDVGLVRDEAQLSLVKEQFKGATGILVLQLTMGILPQVKSLLELGLPVMVYTVPYAGHEWHTIASLQREGRLVEVLPSSRFEDIAVAVRPFRAIHRLKEARILHVNHGEADPTYCKSIRDKFGSQILSLKLEDLRKAYDQADAGEVQADADRWLREAEQVVEPSKEDVLKGSRMYIAMRDLLARHQAEAITMNCLGMGLIDRGMGYPCLGFVRFNNELRAGVCEADLKSTMTQLLFTHLVGRTGFVTDPVFDLATNTIIHAHCVGATQMEGPETRPSAYHIRTHLEDGRGVSLQVRMPVGGKVSMARLIGTDLMLFSTGDAVDSPFVDRACRTKLTMRVENIDRFLENWSCGLHRVVFYGDHTRDLGRFCRFKQIRLLREGVDDLRTVPGLEWDANVHA
jgi:L-fucose isomerase-like protein